MLSHLREYIALVLGPVQRATLATSGPAGLLAHVVPCHADGIVLYLLLPQTSDHLLNLECSPEIVVATDTWQVRGCARRLSVEQHMLVPYFDQRTEKPWSVTIEVAPRRVDIAQLVGWGAAETIDMSLQPESIFR